MSQLSFVEGNTGQGNGFRQKREQPRAMQFTIPWQSTAGKKTSKPVDLTPYEKSKPRPREIKKKPQWNDDVKQNPYFDQALAKMTLFNAPKKVREAAQKTTLKPKQIKKAIKNAKEGGQNTTQKMKSTQSTLTRSLIKEKRQPTNASTVERKRSDKAKSNSVQNHRDEEKYYQLEPIERKKDQKEVEMSSSDAPKSHPDALTASQIPLNSPVRKNNNQEVKDDHVAFPSFPPPTIEINEPPRNIHLIQSTFRVIDSKRKGKIQSREIHQGLQLLGITSTLRQIADYLYLVNDGQGDSIGMAEWVTLVQTLQSSAWAVGSSHHSSPHRNEISFPPSPVPSFMDIPVHTATQSSPIQTRQEISTHRMGDECNTQVMHEGWFIDQIERRVNDMFVRAEAAVAHRLANQLPQSPEDEPREFLRRAASVVHGLKSSLYPLVHQAEETLKAIQSRHASNLSVFLSPQDLNKITSYSEDLCEMLLDDILMDTAMVFTDVEKTKSIQQNKTTKTKQLEQLLDLIESIEAEEIAIGSVVWDLPSIQPKEPFIVPLTTLMATAVDHVACEWEIEESATLPSVVEMQDRHENVAISTSNIANIAERIESNRSSFFRSRRIAEASLLDTGLEQYQIIEILEGMVLDDVVDEIAVELESVFNNLGDKIVRTV